MDDFTSIGSPGLQRLEDEGNTPEFLSPEPDDFVPDSLTDFINAAKATLQDAQLSLQCQFDSPSKASTRGDDDDWNTPNHHDMHEDEDDRKFRQEVMYKFNGEQLFSPKNEVTTSPAVLSQLYKSSSNSATAATLKVYRSDKFMTPASNDFEEKGEDSVLVEDEFSLALESLSEPDFVLDPPVILMNEERLPLESAEYPKDETPQIVEESFGSMTLLAKSSISVIKQNAAALTTSPLASNAQVQLDTPSSTVSYASNHKTNLFSEVKSSKVPTSVSIQIPPSPQLAGLGFAANTEFEKSPDGNENEIRPLPIAGRQAVPVLDQAIIKASLVSTSRQMLSTENIAEFGANSTFHNRSNSRGSPIPQVSPVVSFPPELWSRGKSALVPCPNSQPRKEQSSDLNTGESISLQQSKELIDQTKTEIEKSYTDLLPRDIDGTNDLDTTTRKIDDIATCDCTLKIPSPREDMKASKETAPREDSSFLPSEIEIKRLAISEHDDIFLPNKLPATEISAQRSKESIARTPTGRSIVERLAGSTITNRETLMKKTITKISGRASYSPTTNKQKNITPPPLFPKRISSTRYRTDSPTSLVRIGKPSLPSKETIPYNSDDAVAKARARIQKRQLLEKQQQRQVEESARKQGVITKVVSRNKVLSADDRRGRERVIVQHSEANTKQHGAYSQRLVKCDRVEGVTIVPKRPNVVTKTIRGTTSHAYAGRHEGASLESNSLSQASILRNYAGRPRSVTTDNSNRPLLTKPMGPRLSTTAKYGDKPTPSSQETLKRSSMQVPIRNMPAPKIPLAVPKPPRLQTRMKYGDKTTSSLQGEKSVVPHINVSTIITCGRPRLTTPVPFKFHESKAIPFPQQIRKEELSLAESMNFFMEKGLRNDTPIMKTKRDMTLTIPKSPNFTPLLKRTAPKSTAEKEKEVMDYYEAHPFKASKVRISLSSSNGQTVIPTAKKRKFTIPEPFQLKGDDRVSLSNPAPIPTDLYRSLSDLEECKKQFQARPLPDLSRRSPLKTDINQAKAVTTPEPFRLAAEGRKPKEPCEPTQDEKEMEKQFRALPLPRSTFASPPQRRIGNGIPTTIIASEYLTFQPPKLATSARTEKRVASKEASRKNTELVLKQRDRMRLRKQHEKHMKEIASGTLYSPMTPTNPEPFQLSSLIRHENFQRRLEEQRQQELILEKRKRSFLARPVRATPPPQKIESQKPLTQPEPFRLNTTSRHEHFEKDRRSKEEGIQKEMTRLATPKARPLPDFQTYKPITPNVAKKLVEPVSPELASKRRAQQRREFDERVEQTRQIESARKKTIIDKEAADQEAEMQERRRLPVQEGGLMHQAKPINAGLEKFQ